MSAIELTLKSRETEETLDVYFYRPCGYVLAILAKSMGVTPDAVTLLGSLVGIVAGHLFFYNDLTTNLAGVGLLLFSEMMDSADGQLARMTQKVSTRGRILDGVGDNLKFVSIYLHICLRIVIATQWWWIFVVAVLSGTSHSFQSAMADYYRTAYLFFTVSHGHNVHESSDSIVKVYAGLSWKTDFWTKLYMRVYLNYTLQQESITLTFRALEVKAAEQFGETIPAWFSDAYRVKNKPMMKYYNILTTNTRMFVLILGILINLPWVYFAFELVVLNLLFAAVLFRQNGITKSLLASIA
jgi:phosphatidylglycerophosphate synthase